MKNIIMFLTLLITASVLPGQTVFTKADEEICIKKFEMAQKAKLEEKPIAEVIAEIGKSFLGLDYEAYTLEAGKGDEKLIVHLTGLDCTTFLENSLVFARCIKQGKTSFEDYQAELTKVRYRDGKLDKFPSRLHYFTDWIYNNEKKGIVENITKSIGGVTYPVKVYVMSKCPDKYEKLKENPSLIPVIKKIENEINSRQNNYYIPKKKLSKVEGKIQTGDLIAITTKIKGIDIAHVGVAVRQDDGRIHFMHAPIVGKKVQITEKPLSDYLLEHDKQTGIMVLRAVEPQK
jgi:hypothetical protein